MVIRRTHHDNTRTKDFVTTVLIPFSVQPNV